MKLPVIAKRHTTTWTHSALEIVWHRWGIGVSLSFPLGKPHSVLHRDAILAVQLGPVRAFVGIRKLPNLTPEQQAAHVTQAINSLPPIYQQAIQEIAASVARRMAERGAPPAPPQQAPAQDGIYTQGAPGFRRVRTDGTLL